MRVRVRVRLRVRVRVKVEAHLVRVRVRVRVKVKVRVRVRVTVTAHLVRGAEARGHARLPIEEGDDAPRGPPLPRREVALDCLALAEAQQRRRVGAEAGEAGLRRFGRQTR